VIVRLALHPVRDDNVRHDLRKSLSYSEKIAKKKAA
jgi:hypothetical protein